MHLIGPLAEQGVIVGCIPQESAPLHKSFVLDQVAEALTRAVLMLVEFWARPAVEPCHVQFKLLCPGLFLLNVAVSKFLTTFLINHSESRADAQRLCERAAQSKVVRNCPELLLIELARACFSKQSL